MDNICYYTIEYCQNNWDSLLERVENGEIIGIVDGKNKFAMIPADDELIRIYTDHEEGS